MIYTQIVSLLLYGDTDGSNKLLNQYLKEIRSIKDIRIVLIELNAFLFTYFSNASNNSYNYIFYEQRKAILSSKSRSSLLKLSSSILYAYANSPRNPIVNKLVKETVRIVNKNYYDSPSLKSIAKELKVGENYLSRIFQKETGFTYSQYLNLRKINFAKKILEKTDRKLSYIADFCGFSSPSHFSTAFKKYVKISPSEYRKKFRK